MNTITKAAIAEIRRRHPRALPKGFHPAMRELLLSARAWRPRPPADEPSPSNQAPDDPWTPAEQRERWHRQYKPGFIPDLFEIDDEDFLIRLYEIEDTHPIDDAKLAAIVDWWFTLDNYTDWDVRLFVTDRYGQSERELSIANAYMQFLGGDPNEPEAKLVAKRMGIDLHE